MQSLQSNNSSLFISDTNIPANIVVLPVKASTLIPISDISNIFQNEYLSESSILHAYAAFHQSSEAIKPFTLFELIGNTWCFLSV